MKKNTLLYLILLVLVIMNGFFVYTFLKGPNHNLVGQQGNPTEFIAKELGFNETQLEQLKQLDKSHRMKMMRSEDEIKVLKDKLFGNLSNPSVRPSSIDSLTTLIGIREKEKDMNVFSHFKAIQEICNDNQKKRFQNILKDALHPNGRQGGEGLPPPPRR